jgi:hypothetical protein
MIYSGYTFQGCYSAISTLQAYFLPTHGNRETSVLEKLPYDAKFKSAQTHNISREIQQLPSTYTIYDQFRSSCHLLSSQPIPNILFTTLQIPYLYFWISLSYISTFLSKQKSYLCVFEGSRGLVFQKINSRRLHNTHCQVRP